MGVTKHVFESAFLVRWCAKNTHFPSKVVVVKSAPNDRLQIVKIERSRDVIARSGLHRFHRTFHCAKRGNQNDNRIGVVTLKLFEQVDAGKLQASSCQ